MSTSINKQETVEKCAEEARLFLLEEGIFSEYFSSPGRLLDLRCVIGRATRPLKDLGHHVVGVDFSSELVEQARKHHPDIEFNVGDVCALEFDDASFDHVLFSLNGLDRLYPMQKRMDALSEIHRVLRPGRTFIYSSHDRDTLFNPVLPRDMRIKYNDGSYHSEVSEDGDVVNY